MRWRFEDGGGVSVSGDDAPCRGDRRDLSSAYSNLARDSVQSRWHV